MSNWEYNNKLGFKMHDIARTKYKNITVNTYFIKTLESCKKIPKLFQLLSDHEIKSICIVEVKTDYGHFKWKLENDMIIEIKYDVGDVTWFEIK